MAGRLISLAAGTVLDVGPADAVTVAADAGFPAVGIWFDPLTWTEATTKEVATRLRDSGVVALDIEPVILGRGADPGDEVVDVAAALGARHVLVASGPAERADVLDRFAALCDRAAPAGVTMVLEFLPIFTVGRLGSAVEIVQKVGRPNAGVLVDTLHLARSGGSAADRRAAPARLLPYLQLADAPAAAPPPEQLRDEALYGRLLPGDGALPLAAVLDAVPAVPVSLEIRSRTVMDAYPDPTQRAKAVLAATRQLPL
jgi:sugar phosphate isomerase/epimerase